MRILEELALLVHGGLATGHLLAAYYNYRKAGKVDWWVLFHCAAAGVDLIALKRHLRRITTEGS